MTKIFLFVFIFLMSEALQAQPITWQRGYSLNQNPELSGATSIVEKSGGGYIVVGKTPQDGMFAMGINSQGDSLWYRTYNLVAAFKIINLDSNYLIMSGRTELIKIDSVGNVLWTNLPPNYNYSCTQIRLVNNNIFISGQNNDTERPFFLKKDNLGVNIFYKEYSNLAYGVISDFVTLSSEFISYGLLIPPNSFLNHIDSNGNLIVKNINFQYSLGSSMIRFPHGESLMLGGSSLFGATLVKTDLEGNIIWRKSYDPGYPVFGSILYLMNDINGGIISFGESALYVHFKSRLIKFDYEGNILWQRVFGFDDDQLFPRYIIQTKDSGYIFVGDRTKLGYNFQIVKTDKNGNVNSTSINGNTSNIPEDIVLFQNYPNPFNSSTVIKFVLKYKNEICLSLFDLNGKLVQTIEKKIFEKGEHEIHYQPQGLATGIYFCILKTSNQKIFKKLMYLK